LSVADVHQIRDALDAGHAVVATIEHRGFILAGELRHPVRNDHARPGIARAVGG